MLLFCFFWEKNVFARKFYTYLPQIVIIFIGQVNTKCFRFLHFACCVLIKLAYIKYIFFIFNYFRLKCIVLITVVLLLATWMSFNEHVTNRIPVIISSKQRSVRHDITTAERNSTEVRHIGFVKVHKAASSTMQNIFFRFGLRRNLSFVFTTNPNYFSKYGNITYPLVPAKLRDGNYDVFCIHGIFSEKQFAKILPADTVYVAIVRDPINVFISGVNYYSQYLPYLRQTPGNKLRSLIEHPEKYDKSNFSYTKNVIARDFGFNKVLNDSAIAKRLTELDNWFTIVLVAEYFDESLVLMRRYLNWRMSDILYMPINVREKKNGWSVLDLNETHILKIQERNKLDFSIYKFFYERFWEKFRSEGEDIHSEVLHFKAVLYTVRTFCHRVTNSNQEKLLANKKIYVRKSKWNDEFEVKATRCKLMKKDELTFIKMLRRIQGSVINETLY